MSCSASAFVVRRHRDKFIDGILDAMCSMVASKILVRKKTDGGQQFTWHI